MNAEKCESTDKIPSGCFLPMRVEKADTSSSHQSGSSLHWDYDSWTLRNTLKSTGRIRPSSWDESDGDDAEKEGDSNKLRKEYTESEDEEKKDLEKSENFKKERRSNGDRRRSSARMRRRTKNSSRSSPVSEMEPQNSPEEKQQFDSNEIPWNESDLVPRKVMELDSNYYLNNFFSELRSKKLNMFDPISENENFTKDTGIVYDPEMIRELKNLETTEDGGFFCKTSRKLSQILEVEENRKDFEKNFGHGANRLDFHKTSLKSDNSSPLQTARSKKSPKIFEDKQKKNENFKSLSNEEFGNFSKVLKPSIGSLSERSAKIFKNKIDHDYIALSPKSGKTRLETLTCTDNESTETPVQIICVKPITEHFSPNEPPINEEEENNPELLKTDMKKNLTRKTRKNADESEKSHGGKSNSPKSRKSNPQSPKFFLTLWEDSPRSLKVEDIDTLEYSEKNKENKTNTHNREEYSPRKSKNSPLRSVESSLISQESSQSSSKRSFRDRDRMENKESERKKGKHRKHTTKLELESMETNNNLSHDKSESSSTVETGRSFITICNNSNRSENRKGSFLKDSNEPVFKASSSRTSRSSQSPKTPKTVFDYNIPDLGSPKVPDFGVSLELLEIPESQTTSYRSERNSDLDGVRDQSQMNTPHSRRGLSKNDFSSRRSEKSSSRSQKKVQTKSTSSSTYNLESEMKEGDRNTEESPALELGNISNPPSLGSSTRRSNWREEYENTSQEHSQRTEQSKDIVTFDSTERLSNSKKSSRHSIDSWDRNVAESSGNVSPIKSGKLKSRPTSEECKLTGTFFETDKRDAEATSGRSTNRSFAFEEDEEKEETYSTHRSRSGTESDRHSNKRLSIINEASFECFESSNASTETEEKEIRGNSSRARSKRNKLLSSIDSETFSKPSNNTEHDSIPSKLTNSDQGKWAELIETFRGSHSSLFLSEKNFPGFPPPEDDSSLKSSKILFYSGRRDISSKSFNYDDEDNSEGSLKQSRGFVDNKISVSEKNPDYDNEDDEEEEEETVTLDSDYKNSLVKKIKNEDVDHIQNTQNIYFFNVNKNTPFGIGEFGDVSCWNAGKYDTVEPIKPKDHGDGLQMLDNSTIFPLKSEKREKETKIQRQLWTELRVDLRESKALFKSRFSEIETPHELNRFIPISLKSSKSDTCVNIKLNEEIESRISTIQFLSDKNIQKKHVGLKKSRNRKEDEKKLSSSGSLFSIKTDLENSEKTPRVSRSMSEIDLRKDQSKNIKSRESSKTEAADNSKGNLLLTHKKTREKMAVKTNNWLSFKHSDKKKSQKVMKKSKMKPKTNNILPAEPYYLYLSSRKDGISIPALKLRNKNCFQNFYKRFISVFCMTSSSAATSK